MLRRTTNIIDEHGSTSTSSVDELFSDIHVEVAMSLEDSLSDFFKLSKVSLSSGIFLFQLQNLTQYSIQLSL